MLQIGHFQVSPQVLVQDHSNENDFDLRRNGCASETHCHMKGFAHRLVCTGNLRQLGNGLFNEAGWHTKHGLGSMNKPTAPSQWTTSWA